MTALKWLCLVGLAAGAVNALVACGSDSAGTTAPSAGMPGAGTGNTSGNGGLTGATGGTGGSTLGLGGHGGGGAQGVGGSATSVGGGMAGSSGSSSCTACPINCCDAGSTCTDDGTGNLSCAKACTTSAECPSTSPCCVLLKDGTGACGAGASNVLCRCQKGSECSTSACAPNTDVSGNPVGPYVCTANDGGAYHGCFGALVDCGTGYCCFTDSSANQFCASQCSNTSQCGAASCVPYSNSHTSCAGTMGCGPG